MFEMTKNIINQIDMAHLEEAYEETKTSAEYRQKCIDMYEGNQLKYIEHYCHFTDVVRQKQMQYSFSNITQKIINRVCLTYINPPIRTIQQKSRQERYNQITKGKRKVMMKVDRLSELLDNLGLKLEWDEKKQAIKYRPIYKKIYFEYDQYGDDVVAVYFPIFPCAKDKKDGQRVMYEYWDMENRVILKYNGKPSKYQEEYGFYDNINHYGMIPVIDIVKDGLYAKGLINANEMVNAGLTQLNELVKFKAFNVPFVTGMINNDTIVYNVDTMLRLDTGETAGSIENNTEIEKIVEAIKFQIQLIAENYGVTFNWSIVGNVSGFSLMVQNVELYDQLKLDNEIKQDWEQRIFELENRIIEVDAKGESYGDTLDVNFIEYQLPMNTVEQDAHENHLLATGQTNPIKLMMLKDQDLTLEEAIKDYNDNMSFLKQKTEATTPSVPEDETLKAIVNG